MCRFCYYRVAIERPFLQFYDFPNILSKHNSVYTKFCTPVFGNVYEIRTKNQLNMAINFEVIIILSHFFRVIFDLLMIRHFFVTEQVRGES